MNESQENAKMQIKRVIIVTTVIAAAALSACRKEVPHKPMKLGGDVPATEQVKR
jgi:hypothetical protein